MNISKIGSIIYSLPFISFGAMHLMKSGDMAGQMLADWPMAQVMVIIAGIALIAGGVAIIANKMTKMAGFGIALLMAVFIVTLHIPKLGSEDEMVKMMGMVGLHKDLALLGAALFIAGKADN